MLSACGAARRRGRGEKRMQGRLIYVMGPSGSGKDSLMAGLMEEYPDAGLVAARRYITRPADAGGEQHVAVTPERFQELSREGFFCMQWQSHGLFYGVPSAIRDDIGAGSTVLVNGSRGYLPEAMQTFPFLEPLLVDVPQHLLEERLISRGREKGLDLSERLRRGQMFQEFPEGTLHVENAGTLEQGIENFARALGLPVR